MYWFLAGEDIEQYEAVVLGEDGLLRKATRADADRELKEWLSPERVNGDR